MVLCLAGRMRAKEEPVDSIWLVCRSESGSNERIFAK